MRHSRSKPLAMFAAVTFAIRANAAVAGPAEQIGACMQQAATTLHFSGTVTARHGSLIIERSFGTADAAGHVPNTSTTRFNIGSISTLFTAIAIGRLVDRGAIRFGAPIWSFLPGPPFHFGYVTIDTLLTHSSGLGDYLTPANRAAIDAAKTATDLLPLATATQPSFAPNTDRAYSTSGFIILGAIIENISHQSWARFIQQDII